MSWFLQPNILLLEGFSLLAKPALRPRMLFRALRPPMIFGASLPGMIFPAERPAEGSNSYHYGSYATIKDLVSFKKLYKCFHTTMVLTQRNSIYCIVFLYYGFHTTMVLTQRSATEFGYNENGFCFHTTMVHIRAVLR